MENSANTTIIVNIIQLDNLWLSMSYKDSNESTKCLQRHPYIPTLHDTHWLLKPQTGPNQFLLGYKVITDHHALQPHRNLRPPRLGQFRHRPGPPPLRRPRKTPLPTGLERKRLTRNL